MNFSSISEVVALIKPVDADAAQRASRRQGSLTKPPGSLGVLEDISVQLAGILGTEKPRIDGKAVVVAAGDHGVVAQGITGYPQEVTAQMVLNFLAGGAAVSVMAKRLGVELVVVNAGIVSELPDHPGVRVVDAGPGTSDITQGPAMTPEQAELCLLAGARISVELAESGADLIGAGDMGIGNTTASVPMTAAITGRSPHAPTANAPVAPP